MRHFTAYTLLFVVAVLLETSQSANNACYYLGSPGGTKCFDPTSDKNLCCPPGDHCENGKCIPFRATPPSKPLPFSTPVLIGISVSIVAFVCLIFGAMYWHRRQMRNAETRTSLSVSFSQSTQAPKRTSSSAGFRGRSCTAQPKSNETCVSIERSTTVTA